MLNRLGQEGQSSLSGSMGENASADIVDLDRLLSAVRRQVWVVGGSILLCLALGVAFIVTAVPQYAATADILVDNRRVNAVADSYALTEAGTASGVLDSEVKVILSERVAQRVVDKLGLASNQAFMAGSAELIPTLVKTVRDFMANFSEIDGEQALSGSPDDLRARAVQLVLDRLKAQRSGQTYVLQVQFTDPDPKLAAKIATTTAEEYLNDQMETAYDASRRASEWLQTRIQDLQTKSVEADQAVEKFKSDHGMVEAGNVSVSDQQLSGLNAQLISARAATSEKLARLQRIQSIIKSQNMSAAVSEALDNPIITGLRTKYLDASKRYEELSKLLGPDHQQVKSLQNDMNEYSRLMFTELGRIAQSYESDYEIAKAQETTLEARMNEQMGVTEASNGLKAQLGELERQAATYRDLHQSYLTRYQDVIQQQSFPVSEARILNYASVPGSPASPKKGLVLAISGLLGVILGVAVGAFIEYRDRFFRTSEQVRDELQLEFLGNLPRIEGGDQKPAPAAATSPSTPGNDSPWPDDRVLSNLSMSMRYATVHALSGYAETLRSAKLAVDRSLANQPLKVVGVTSVLPGEGKSTVAKNFASLLAGQGARVMLIDGDLRHPALSRELANVRAPGLVHAVNEHVPLNELLYLEQESGLFFLPGGGSYHSSLSGDMLASTAMGRFLKRISNSFDYVVLDLPPAGPVVDAKAASVNVDEFLFVVEWGRTARRLVRATLANNPEIYEKCIGVIYNKADMKKMRMYAVQGDAEQYYSEYAKYYRN